MAGDDRIVPTRSRPGPQQKEILELRRDPELTREIVTRLVEQNATMLKKRALPVTPGTLYLAHFAGPAGAVAVLSVSENADALHSWRALTRAAGQREKSSSMPIHSSKSSRSAISRTGPIGR